MSELIPDPEHSDQYIVANAAEPFLGEQVGEAVLTNVHHESQCQGRPCVVHRPSDHHMRTWRLNWRGDLGIFERLCQHGVGHPDPDSLAYLESIGREGFDVHGCDTCCRTGLS